MSWDSWGPGAEHPWWLGDFAVATPEQLAKRALLRRFDTKFVLPAKVGAEVIASVSNDYAVLLAGDARLATYRTLYFDTEDLRFFHDHRRGRRPRQKVRIRHYPERRVSFLEIKHKRGETQTIKHRRERDYGRSQLNDSDLRFIAEHTGITNPVRPQVWTNFRRATLVGIDVNERITVDLDLHLTDGHTGRRLTNAVVLEVKQWPRSRRSPIFSALRAAHCRPASASKYCTGIAYTRPDVRRNRLNPRLRQLLAVEAA